MCFSISSELSGTDLLASLIFFSIRDPKPNLYNSLAASLKSPDGISECERFGAEAKCLSRKEHTKLLYENELPKDKLCQIIHYFTANPKFEKVWFIAFRPESIKPFILEFTKDTLVDLGWKIDVEIEVIGKKGTPIKPKIEKHPDVKKISEWNKIAIQESEKLEIKIKESINKLKF